MTPVFFAPMEGLTDTAYRRVHHECFAGVESYYIPFISPTQNLVLTGREKRNVLPEYNRGVPCVPQVLAKDRDQFLWAANLLAGYGYSEVNLNAGCPSSTVTAKGKGAGMLREPEKLEAFLDAVCAASPLPVSVKTRIAYDSPEEWAALLAIYARYPLKRLILHPRTRRERYDPGTLHMECWQAAREAYPGELIYNGDLFTPTDIARMEVSASRPDGVMLGRGLVANPALARIASGGAPLKKEELVRFHDRLLEEMESMYQPDIVFMKLRVVMKHIGCCFAGAEKVEKQIRKSRKLAELLEVDRRLFAEYGLKPEPAYVPE